MSISLCLPAPFTGKGKVVSTDPSTLKSVMDFSQKAVIFLKEELLGSGYFQKHSDYIFPLNSAVVEANL